MRLNFISFAHVEVAVCVILLHAAPYSYCYMYNTVASCSLVHKMSTYILVYVSFVLLLHTHYVQYDSLYLSSVLGLMSTVCLLANLTKLLYVHGDHRGTPVHLIMYLYTVVDDNKT